MKIASWNVNSIRVRLEPVIEWLDAEKPDALCLQEIKVTNDKFPLEEFEAAGWTVAINGQKTYNGVATISREPVGDIVTEIPDFDDPQARVLAATVMGVRVINLYVPNGKAVGTESYQYKLAWLDALIEYLKAERDRYDDIAVLGDFNIAPDDRDVHDPEEWAGKVLCSDEERARYESILALGFSDTFRLFEQPERTYSWWDYRRLAFQRKRGLRIDLVLASEPLAGRCVASTVDKEPRKQEKPSDHAPVIAEFED